MFNPNNSNSDPSTIYLSFFLLVDTRLVKLITEIDLSNGDQHSMNCMSWLLISILEVSIGASDILFDTLYVGLHFVCFIL